jgi:hypothetical protein
MTLRLRDATNILKSAALTAVLLSTFSFSTATQADEIERLVSSLCESAKADDRSGMRKKLKSAKIRLSAIYPGIKCDTDGSLLRAATNANAIDAATFIATKIGKDNLQAPEPDGKNIIQWAEGLVAGGDASKQAFVDLFISKL